MKTKWNGRYTVGGGYIITDEGLNSRIVAQLDRTGWTDQVARLLARVNVFEDAFRALSRAEYRLSAMAGEGVPEILGEIKAVLTQMQEGLK